MKTACIFVIKSKYRIIDGQKETKTFRKISTTIFLTKYTITKKLNLRSSMLKRAIKQSKDNDIIDNLNKKFEYFNIDDKQYLEVWTFDDKYIDLKIIAYIEINNYN